MCLRVIPISLPLFRETALLIGKPVSFLSGTSNPTTPRGPAQISAFHWGFSSHISMKALCRALHGHQRTGRLRSRRSSRHCSVAVHSFKPERSASLLAYANNAENKTTNYKHTPDVLITSSTSTEIPAIYWLGPYLCSAYIPWPVFCDFLY